MPTIYKFDDYEVQEYIKTEIDQNLVDLIKVYCEKTFAAKRSNYQYFENYIWNTNDYRTLAYKLSANQFEYVYVVYLKSNFISFSGLYLNKFKIAFAGARRFSTNNSPLSPYHFAYVIPLQHKRAVQLGSYSFVIPYNHDIRSRYFEYTTKLVTSGKKRGSKEINIIQSFSNSVDLQIQREPVLCNTVLQHLIYCMIDPLLTTEDFFELIK